MPESCDIYVVGGGEDTAQTLAVRHLREHPGMQRAAARGAVILGVCAGIQIFGESFTRADQVTHAGLGLIDSTSHAGGSRAIGEVIATPADGLFEGLLTGFENHQGRTVLGRPPVRSRTSRWARATTVRWRAPSRAGSCCTYLHGPVLPRNPQIADLLIEWATGAKLRPLDLPDVTRLRTERAKAAGVSL